MRVLFAAEPGMADEVHRRIDDALRTGSLLGPDGVVTRWSVVASGGSAVAPEERDRAERLVRS